MVTKLITPYSELSRPNELGFTGGGHLSQRHVHDYEQNVAWAKYRAAMRAADLAIAKHQSDVDLPPAVR